MSEVPEGIYFLNAAPLNLSGNVHYYLFSKSGFTKGCMEKAEEMGNVTLVSYGDIVGSMK